MKRSLATDDVWMSTNPDREEMDRQNFPSDSSNCIGSPFFDDKVLDVEVERTSNTDMTSNNSERLIVTDRKEITKDELGQVISRRKVGMLMFPIQKAHHDTFISIQKWEGTILEEQEETFVARLVDLTHRGPDEIAEFPIGDVQEDELRLVEPGAVFLLNIGYMISKGGQRSRQTLLLFRDLPVWRQSDFESARERARKLWESLGPSAK
jgi:hypothetical protein